LLLLLLLLMRLLLGCLLARRLLRTLVLLRLVLPLLPWQRLSVLRWLLLRPWLRCRAAHRCHISSIRCQLSCQLKLTTCPVGEKAGPACQANLTDEFLTGIGAA
jgi:hypothetical protein